jgi:hypothetical protein
MDDKTKVRVVARAQPLSKQSKNSIGCIKLTVCSSHADLMSEYQ